MNDLAYEQAVAARFREQDAFVFSIIRRLDTTAAFAVAVVVAIASFWSDMPSQFKWILIMTTAVFFAANVVACLEFRVRGSMSRLHTIADAIELATMALLLPATGYFTPRAYAMSVVIIAIFAIHSAMSPISRLHYRCFLVIAPSATAVALLLSDAKQPAALLAASGAVLFVLHLLIQAFSQRQVHLAVRRELLAAERSEGKERQRIASDLHDTVMAQLFALQNIAAGQHGEHSAEFARRVAELSRQASRDVYASIAKLSSPEPLAERVTLLRHECQLMCTATGAEFEASIPDATDSVWATFIGTAERFDHLRAIVLEALRNMLTHRESNVISMQLFDSDETLLAIASNGGPATSTLKRSGYGTQSLQSRADKLQCRVELTANEETASLRLIKTDAN